MYRVELFGFLLNGKSDILRGNMGYVRGSDGKPVLLVFGVFSRKKGELVFSRTNSNILISLIREKLSHKIRNKGN